MTARVSLRALGRATLARQLLLERSDLCVPAAVEHLVGLQAQTPHTWYVGLWSRLADLDPVAVGRMLEDGQLVRLALMRSTLHLVTVQDAVALRPVVKPAVEAVLAGAQSRDLSRVERDGLCAAARDHLAAGPCTGAALGLAMQEHWPDVSAQNLARAARAWLPLVQVPPRGVWGRSGQARVALLAGADPSSGLDIAGLVRRYLAAAGPATTADLAGWSGVRGMGEVVDRLRPGLLRLAGPDGQDFLDLPDAPRPPEDVEAPVRYLYDFDDVLLSHEDRRRVVGSLTAQDWAEHGYGPTTMRQPSTVLVDGTIAATWTADRSRERAVLHVRAFRRLNPQERSDVEAEGRRLLAFLHPGRDHEVRLL